MHHLHLAIKQTTWYFFLEQLILFHPPSFLFFSKTRQQDNFFLFFWFFLPVMDISSRSSWFFNHHWKRYIDQKRDPINTFTFEFGWEWVKILSIYTDAYLVQHVYIWLNIYISDFSNKFTSRFIYCYLNLLLQINFNVDLISFINKNWVLSISISFLGLWIITC